MKLFLSVDPSACIATSQGQASIRLRCHISFVCSLQNTARLVQRQSNPISAWEHRSAASESLLLPSVTHRQDLLGEIWQRRDGAGEYWHGLYQRIEPENSTENSNRWTNTESRASSRHFKLAPTFKNKKKQHHGHGLTVVEDVREDLAAFGNPPLQHGIPSEGWLCFVVRGTKDTLLQGAALHLTLMDSFNGKHKLKTKGLWNCKGSMVNPQMLTEPSQHEYAFSRAKSSLIVFADDKLGLHLTRVRNLKQFCIQVKLLLEFFLSYFSG